MQSLPSPAEHHPAPRPDSQRPCALLRALAAVTGENPTVRKRFVGPDINYGREYLTALARITGGWVGWEAATLRSVAEELAFVPLAERSVRPASDIEVGALVNRALDRVISQGRVSSRFGAMARSQGFRRSVRDSILELRMSGVPASAVRAVARADSPVHDLPFILEEYTRLLHEEKLTDPAGVFVAALEGFDREAAFILDGVILLAPTLIVRGLPGRLLEKLLHHGARPVAIDPVFGIEPPELMLGAHAVKKGGDAAAMTGADAMSCSLLSWLAAPEPPPLDDPRLDQAVVSLDLFAGATPFEELREVCRRVVAEGLRWDQVEIAATDVDVYGIALDALCQQLGIGATMLHGVPLARTRLGRALDRWLAWLDDGLPADVLRQALEAGELRAPASDLPSTALARELRQLRIGWGRPRYEAALIKLENGHITSAMKAREDESDHEFALRRESRRHTEAALAGLLRSLLAALPEVPQRGSDRPVRASCAQLARATRYWLELAAVHGAAEEQTAARIRSRLDQLAEVEEDAVSFSSALAALREAMADVRAWPLLTSERKAWSSSGGMVHLTDVAHAGSTGRPRTFVVGLDADRAGAGRWQDPLLPDEVRRSIANGSLANAVDRREESAFVLFAALASMRGRVTLSYATSGTIDGREAGPSSVLLQAWRLVKRDRKLSYESLREELHPPACAVPARTAEGRLVGIAFLDARDIWLDAIADGALLLDADHVVREAFAMLDGGLRAIEQARGCVATGHHGLVPHAGAILDPLAHGGREISPSALEKLAACPLSWFYRYGLSLYLPDDPEYDAEQWLDALQRGALLHDVYEAFTREYHGRQDEIDADAADQRMIAIADEAIARARDDVPPPGEAIFELEAAELRRAALAFLQMEREMAARGDRGRWAHFELGFGSGEPPGLYTLEDGSRLSLKGRADRVDELPDGTLRVIDYKTGKAYSRRSKGGPFDSGRRLQPALYSGALELLLGRAVSRFEYRFPTERGGNEIIAYSAQELGVARRIISDLLDHVRSGSFVPTSEAADCSYCDHQEICRARRDGFTTVSPRAAWAGEHGVVLEQYVGMVARRSKGGVS